MAFLNLLTTLRKYKYDMKKSGGSESTIIIGPSKSVLGYTLHSLEYVLGLARFRVFVPNIYIYIIFSDISLLRRTSQMQSLPQTAFSDNYSNRH